jgi:hypothetical protein
MDNFKQFADAINKKFLELSASGTLLRVNISKETLWETYQSSYPAKDNPIFRERRVHECNTCYSFIKRLGAVVGVVDGELDTIWNVQGLPPLYQMVANTMDILVRSGGISSVFLTDESLVGKEYNIEENEAGTIKWEHFYADVDQAYISQDIAATTGSIDSTVAVFKRALEEFSAESLESVMDLCDSIYKGEEFKPTVNKFLAAKQAYESAPNKSIFLWTEYKNYPAKIRNSAIGSLIINIQEGMELELAVAKYEKVVAPSNYKRTSAVVTEGMKKQAVEKIDELGLRNSLPRRHATLTDISVNNVLFADASAQAIMQDPLDDVLSSVASKSTEAPKKAQELTIDQFLENVLPNSRTVELLLENKHTPNLVSLVAPVNSEAQNMLKWNNNFSWSYAGEMTDSMKERVKSAGGSVTGDVRFSIQWNEDGMDGTNDLDAHCYSPLSHISFSSKRGACGGVLDVDITRPSTQTKDGTAVENITWNSIKSMPDGQYNFIVNNYSGRNTKGFRAQVEILGEIFEYSYDKSVTSDVTVAVIAIRNSVPKIVHKLPCSTVQRTEWSLDTKQYQRVSTIMLSPNHWDEQKIGNKHYFFMLDGCSNPDPVRGFYNEFLSEDLRPHRKFFEILSSKMKCTPVKEQLSGLGFSSTQRNEVFVKVDSRPYKIIF